MRRAILVAALVALAACSKKDPDPTPTPTPTPAAVDLTGHWQADAVYVLPQGNGGTALITKLGNASTLDGSSGSLSVAGPAIRMIYATASPATTTYTFAAPVLKYPAQTAGGGTDSLVAISTTSFRWSHQDGTKPGMSGYRLVAVFHR